MSMKSSNVWNSSRRAFSPCYWVTLHNEVKSVMKSHLMIFYTVPFILVSVCYKLQVIRKYTIALKTCPLWNWNSIDNFMDLVNVSSFVAFFKNYRAVWTEAVEDGGWASQILTGIWKQNFLPWISSHFSYSPA